MATLCFDSWGTLVDNYSIVEVMEPHIGDSHLCQRISTDWRFMQKWSMFYLTLAERFIAQPGLTDASLIGIRSVHIITSDLFHLYEEHTPRHSKIYTDLIPIIEDVYTRYRDEVRTHVYPGPEHTVYMDEVELATFAKDMQWDSKLEELEKKRA